MINLDRYIERDSVLHQFDARLKFVLAILVIVSISLLPRASWSALAIAWVTLALLSATAYLGPFRLSRGALFALPFMLAALPLIFTRPANILATFELGPLPLSISGQGLEEFATIAIKSWVSVQVALLLTFTTPFHDLVAGLRRLRMPAIIVGTISFMYRYLAVLSDEAGRMMRARAARSASPDGTGGGTSGLAPEGDRRDGGLSVHPLLRAKREGLRRHAGARLRRRASAHARPLPQRFRLGAVRIGSDCGSRSSWSPASSGWPTRNLAQEMNEMRVSAR